jgi:ABC-2 type transport system permease protein
MRFKSRIVPLLRKEALHILRDPRSLYLAIGLPIVLLILFGYALTLDVDQIPLGIIDLEGSSLSRELIARFRFVEAFDLRHISFDYESCRRLLDEGKAKIVLVIPDHFSRDLARGGTVPLQLLVDGSDNNTALIGLSYIWKVLQQFSSRVVLETLNREGAALQAGFPTIDLVPRVWYNPELRSRNYVVPGLIATVMMILAAMLTSLTVAREWEVGTMEQLIATPARPREIIIGKITPYFVLGHVQIILVVLIGALLFKVPLKGNILFLFLASSLFLICALGIGLLISTVTRSQQLAFMFSVLFTLLPSFLLSGFVFPISSMPKIIQFITYLVPARYFLIILRGIFLKGTGWAAHWPEVLSLLLFAAVLIAACARKMRLSLE